MPKTEEAIFKTGSSGRDSYLFQAVSAVLRAVSFLREQKEVDRCSAARRLDNRNRRASKRAKRPELPIDISDERGSRWDLVGMFGQRSVATILRDLGETEHAVAGNMPVYLGGPVAPELGFVVHSSDYRRPETIDIDGRVAMTSHPEVLRAIGDNRGPSKSFVAFGYAGWGPGQLEREMVAGGWLNSAISSKRIFDTPVEKIWDAVIRDLGFDPAFLVQGGGKQ